MSNTGFEAGLADWQPYTGNETITNDAFAGTKALALAADGAGVRQDFDVVAGESYSLSAYAKASGTGWSGIGLQFLDAQFNIIDGASTQITGANWSQYTLDALAPAGAVSGVLWAWKGGSSGTTTLDEFGVNGAEPPEPPTSGDLLLNSSFESGIANWGIFNGTETVTTSTASDGTRSLQLNTNGSGAQQVAAVTAGKTYQLTAFARTNSTGWSGLGVNFLDNNGNAIDGTAQQIIGNSWSEYELEYTAPINATQASVWVWKGANSGMTYLDDVSLEEVSGGPNSTFALANSDTLLVNEAAGVATVSVVRTGNTQSRATVEYTTNEISGAGSATADSDYTTPTFDGRSNTGQLVFEAGETEASFTIPIVDDTTFEGNETFAVGLQNPSEGSLGAPRTQLITIVDNDAAPVFTVSEPTLSVSEAESTVSLTVQRSGDASSSASVQFRTVNGTATAGEDYTAQSGTLNFAANQTTRTITVPLLSDIVVEGSETFSVRLSNPTGATLGSPNRSTVTILDNDLELGDLNRTTAVSGLTQPTTLDWTPDGEYLLVAEKSGRVRVVDNQGNLRSTPLVDLSDQVNATRDRGLLGLAIHPDFPNTPYVYLLYTYDPPETAGRSGLGGPDGNGNRPSRMVRLTVNPNTMVANPNSLVVLVGTNSTWQYTSEPTRNSTGNNSIRPSGIVNGTTITAPASQIDVGSQDNDPGRSGVQNQNIRDYLATDSESHTIGDLEFGPDGYLYLSNGDGTSYNFTDPRTVRVQDVQNLSGKVLRIDPITGEGIATNPFYDGDADSNQSKVFYSGLRNPFRFAFDPVSDQPVIGDVGWNSFEEINTGPAGANFGWPYFEGPNQTGGYKSLSQAIAFYNNGNRNNPGDDPAVFPILFRTHGAPDNANAIMVGDFYNSETLMFGDINGGTLYAATLNNSRQVTDVQVFDSGISFVVDMKMGPDGRLYGVNLVTGSILRWDPVSSVSANRFAALQVSAEAVSPDAREPWQ